MDVAVYVEGTTEAGSGWRSHPSPGAPLTEQQEGPVHFLVRRSMARSLVVPEASVRFVSPLRRADGAVARGADLLRPKTLRKLLTWSGLAPSPDIAVVLVDHDGDDTRLSRLKSSVGELPLSTLTAVGVAVKEFEAWLSADHERFRAVLESNCEVPERPEELEPRAAKENLRRAHEASNTNKAIWEVRLELGRDSDLVKLERRCPSFREFTDELKRAGRQALEVRRRSH